MCSAECEPQLPYVTGLNVAGHPHERSSQEHRSVHVTYNRDEGAPLLIGVGFHSVDAQVRWGFAGG